MSASMYRKILDENLLPSVLDFRLAGFIFQQHRMYVEFYEGKKIILSILEKHCDTKTWNK